MKDQKLIEGIRCRDPEYIEIAMERYSKLLWSVVSPILANYTPQDIEECVADVFVYLWQNPEKFDESRGTLKTWLAIVARSKAVDRCRYHAAHSTISLEDSGSVAVPDPTDEVWKQDARAALADAVRALGEPDREILVRRYYFDQKPKEIALALNMTVKQIENRLYRTKKRLRGEVAELRRCL